MRKLLAIIILTTSCTSFCDAGLDNLFYHPTANVYTTPSADGYKFEDVIFQSKDGTKLAGWFIPAKGMALGTVIHFHGNAQNMTAHYSFVSWIPANGFNLFVFDYRGYGKSEGKVSRKGIYEDSIAAIMYIETRPDIDQSKIILFGQSLGGANALAVAGSSDFEGIIGVVSDSAFSTYKSVAGDHAGLLKPFAYIFMGNKYSPRKVIHKISPIPLLIIHGTADRVVPYKHGERLFKKAREPKELWTVENGRHTQILGGLKRQYIPKLIEVFKEWADNSSNKESM